MSDRRYTLWFNRIEAISNMVRVKLLDEFESAEAIYRADRSALRRTAILKYSEIEAIESAREQDIDHMWEDLKEMGISFVSGAEDYTIAKQKDGTYLLTVQDEEGKTASCSFYRFPRALGCDADGRAAGIQRNRNLV